MNMSDVPWPACVEDAEFLVFPDGSVQLSSVYEPDSQTASVCLSPTRHVFTARFLAKIGRSSVGHTFRSAQVSEGEVFDTAAVSNQLISKLSDHPTIIRLRVSSKISWHPTRTKNTNPSSPMLSPTIRLHNRKRYKFID